MTIEDSRNCKKEVTTMMNNFPINDDDNNNTLNADNNDLK